MRNQESPSVLVGAVIASVILSIVVSSGIGIAQSPPDIGKMLEAEKLAFRTIQNAGNVKYIVRFKGEEHPIVEAVVAPATNGKFVTVYSLIADIPAGADGTVFRALLQEQTDKVWLGKFVVSEASLYLAIETPAHRLDSEHLGTLVREVARYADGNSSRLKGLLNGGAQKTAGKTAAL